MSSATCDKRRGTSRGARARAALISGRSRPRGRALVISAAVGAGAAILLDPQGGRRRRALVRDKVRRYSYAGARAIARVPRLVAGPARGVVHAVAHAAPWHRMPAAPDEHEFVKHRVETALGREPGLPTGAINIDAADGVVRVRGSVPDEHTARRIVERAAGVEGVRAVVTLMHLPDGRLAGEDAGDLDAIYGPPRAAIHAAEVRHQLMTAWPVLTDADILASEGHIGALTKLICSRTDESEYEVRTALDAILLTAV